MTRRAALVALSTALLLPAAALAAAGPSDPWTRLHRPLQLQRLTPGAPCPVSSVDPSVDWAAIRIFGGTGIGPGPVYPGVGGADVLPVPPDPTFGGAWGSQKVFWYVQPRYRGRVLIRGRRLDGLDRLRFGEGRVPSPELRIERNETVAWDGQPPGSRGVPSSVRARATGCYGVQLDGSSFSRVIVLRIARVPG